MRFMKGWIYTILLAVGAGLVGLVVGLSLPEQPGAGLTAVLAVAAVAALLAAAGLRRRLWRS